MNDAAIGIDLGCTNIKAVVVDGAGNVVREAREETREQDDKHWKRAVKQIAEEFLRASPGIPVGLCAPGLADADNKCIACMPGRLPGLENFDWTGLLKSRTWVLNDAHAALTAEASFGAGRGMKHLLMLTLGSGVGGGLLIDGRLYQGMAQMAGHAGHVTVDANTHLRDVTNMPGSIEEAIGNISVKERSYGKYQTTFELIDGFRRGETFATWLWLDAVRKLAISIASGINLVSPEAVIIGGGISRAQDALMDPLRQFLDLYEWRPGGKHTPVVAAKFSDMAGAIGAAAFALDKTKQNDPNARLS